MKQIENKIYNICSLINDDDNQKKEIGLLTGNSGFAIYLFEIGSKYSDANHQENATEKIYNCINSINTGNFSPTYCNGVAGFCWTLEYLAQNDYVDNADIEIVNNFDEYLHNQMIRFIQQKNYDYLHGAVGVGLYFIKRSKRDKNVISYLDELLDILKAVSIEEADGSLKWKSVVINETGQEAFNLSLSHGITSIIAFTAKLVKEDICREKALNILDGALKYLLKHKKNPLENIVYFPSWVDENDIAPKGGRMAWCYNDLGIAAVLYWVSDVIKDASLKKLSVEILTYHSNTRDLKKAGVADAGLCHGSAGIAHIYYRMFFNTGIESFRESAAFWFDETLKLATFDDGPAGYKAWHTEKYGGWVSEYGILEGIAGIGLAMHSYITGTEPKWDECLLLS